MMGDFFQIVICICDGNETAMYAIGNVYATKPRLLYVYQRSCVIWSETRIGLNISLPVFSRYQKSVGSVFEEAVLSAYATVLSDMPEYPSKRI